MNLLSWNDFRVHIVGQHIRRILAIFAIYLSIAGLVTFSLFILEESFQTVMFGTWPAQDSKRWDVVLKGTDLMEKVVRTMKIVNYSCGWIQPLAFISYSSYAESANYYIDALRTKVIHNQPELMLGRKVEMKFVVKNIIKHDNDFVMSNGRIVFRSDKRVNGVVELKGILTRTGAGYEITGIHGGDVQ